MRVTLRRRWPGPDLLDRGFGSGALVAGAVLRLRFSVTHWRELFARGFPRIELETSTAGLRVEMRGQSILIDWDRFERLWTGTSSVEIVLQWHGDALPGLGRELRIGPNDVAGDDFARLDHELRTHLRSHEIPVYVTRPPDETTEHGPDPKLQLELEFARNLRQSDPKAALAFLDRVRNRYPARSEPWLLRGDWMLEDHRVEQAFAAFRRALACQPNGGERAGLARDIRPRLIMLIESAESPALRDQLEQALRDLE